MTPEVKEAITKAREEKQSWETGTLKKVLDKSPERKKSFEGISLEPVERQAGTYKPAAEADIDAETWFPAELIAQSQLSGDESLKGTAFAADDFLHEPYNQGKITRINDTNYFVLELTAP